MSDMLMQKTGWIAGRESRDMRRYFQFALLLLAAGAIYPLLYLRQNFETTILKAFSISATDLGGFYSMLGVIYALSYLPGGWLADRVSPRLLITFSLAAVGGLGLWFSTYPPTFALAIIFCGWGLAAGLTFWASLIKGVKLLASASEQGRFFGILDGGRGLVEAILATIAISIFAAMSNRGALPQEALRPVIYMYSFTCLTIAVLSFIFLDAGKKENRNSISTGNKLHLIADFKLLLTIPELWLMALIIFCGYQLFWATYSFSAYLQDGYGLTAVAAGFITVTKLWMRPVGGIAAGFLGDRYSNETVLTWSMLLGSLSLFALVIFPQMKSIYFLLFIVVLIGVMTYAVRGLYWAILDKCHVPLHVTGLAIGIVSVIGYLPDIFLPLINAEISRHFPGVPGFKIYFSYIALSGLFGTAVTFYFKKPVKEKKRF